jgi:hypothetical protein
LGHGTAVDYARKVVAGLAAAGVLHGAERAVVDGRIELQPVVPLVLGLSMDDPVWDASTFSKNRDRLLKKKMAKRFFQEVLKQARERNLLSDEHFTVDGTLIEAWASLKSFQRKEQEKQENGDEENVVTLHVIQNEGRRGGSAIDGRTTRHAGYAVSQRKRKRIEECFGWMKTIGLLRKLRHRGLLKVDWVFIFTAAAYNLVRIRICNQPRKLEAEVCLETPPDHLGREENRDFRSHSQKKVKEGLNMSIFSAACEHGYLIISAISFLVPGGRSGIHERQQAYSLTFLYQLLRHLPSY